MTDHISVSQINLFLMCSLKYRFQYVDKLPKPFKSAELALGTSIHAAVEWWHKQRQGGFSPEFQRVVSIFEADLKAQSFDELRYKDGEDLVSLLSKGRELLAVYLRGYNGRLVRNVEMPFRVPLVDLDTGETIDLPLHGYFDLIESGDTVVELKTTSKAYDQTTLDQHLQLTAYAYAYEMVYNRPAKLRLDMLVKTKSARMESVDVARERQDFVRFFHIAKGVSKAIQNESFYPNEGWQCKTCEYFDVCRKWKA